MSTETTTVHATEDDVRTETDAATDGVLFRTFAAELSAGDGRTIDVRIVPYGERIMHNDGHGGVPKGVPYAEEWMPGAFAHQERAANRVLVNFEHQEGLQGIIGHGKTLVERSDGLYGSFKLHETPDGDKALMLVREGVLHGVSLEALDQKSVRARDGVVRRVKAHLHGIALTRKGAYKGAVVLALREAATLVLDDDLLPIPIDPERIERCRRLGMKLPQRYEAHPAETDTPAETGTSEDGTRRETTHGDV
jgi:HK97 family phage prohead protease